LVSAGKFFMGGTEAEEGRMADEGPRHEVSIGKPFYLGKHEVTQEQYEQIMGENRSLIKGPKNPVEMVSWHKAQEFCRKLAERSGRTARLPTEAEWEYACRAGTATRFSCEDSDAALESAAWYSRNAGGKTHPVGKKLPNAFGLHDMHGNVWEWVEDDWHPDYWGAPADGSAWVDSPRTEERVIRGGSWLGRSKFCRSAYRGKNSPWIRIDVIGFRAVVLPETRAATEAAPAAKVGDGPWLIELDRCLIDNGVRNLTLCLGRRDGKWQRGFGIAREWNGVCHDVDCTGLQVTENALKGVVKVVLNCDPWIPPEQKKLTCVYAIEATVRDGAVRGTYEGKFDGEVVSGAVAGKALPPAAVDLERCEVALSLEDAVRLTDETGRRLRIRWRRQDGKTQAAEAIPPAGARVGFDASKLTLTHDALKGDFVVDFGPRGGRYEFAIDGAVVHNQVGGRFRAKSDGRQYEGLFIGAVGSADKVR
jgi:hypothetical protein